MMLAAVLVCLVVGISDGDTLTARCEYEAGTETIKVRLAGIDAPEKSQPFGPRSRQHLGDLAFRKVAVIEARKTDRYGRTVARVLVADPSCTSVDCPQTLDVGMAQLTVGLAWWYRKYASEQPPQERGQYEFAEIESRAKRAGLWLDAEPVAPWSWRKRER